MPTVAPFSDVAAQVLQIIQRKLNAGEFTERQLARLAHTSQGSLNNILHGRRQPSLAMMDRLCKAARIHPLQPLATIATWKRHDTNA